MPYCCHAGNMKNPAVQPGFDASNVHKLYKIFIIFRAAVAASLHIRPEISHHLHLAVTKPPVHQITKRGFPSVVLIINVSALLFQNFDQFDNARLIN